LQIEDRKTLVHEIATKYGRRLRRYLSSRLRNQWSDVSDLEQEVFLRILRVGPESIRNPAAYVMTVAGHVLHQHILRKAVMPESLDALGDLIDRQTIGHPDPAPQVDAQRRLQALDRALDGLAPNVRASLVMSVRYGMTHDEIAARLGVSAPMVRKYLGKAMFHCELQMKAEG
jgi:RNA polymerase sigma-70 factor (ECF subfamily)